MFNLKTADFTKLSRTLENLNRNSHVLTQIEVMSHIL